MGGGGEDGHVRAGLGDDVLGADGADAVHGVELADLAQVGLDQCLDPRVERLDPRAVVVDDVQHHGRHGGVPGGEERAVQRLFQTADLAAHGAAGQLGQGLGVALRGDQRVEHVPAGDGVGVGNHAG